MRKVWINEELFADEGETGMADAVALEEATGMTYAGWQIALSEGSAKALAAYAWLLWRRAGKTVAFGDVMSGEVPLNLESLRFEAADPEPEPDEKGRPRRPTRPTGTPSTGGAT